MSNWNIYTPEGFRDVLFEECYAKRNLEDRIRKMMMQRGFFEIETPSLEFYDAFSPESGLISQETMFKFFDQQGRILVMRPDATISAARVAATKFGEKDFPLKISYICNTYRFNELGGGKQKEFTAAGVEIIGEGNPEADAEVIATAIEVIRSLGIDNFQVDIGQMQFFKGIMEDSGLSVEDVEKVRTLIDRKDFIGLEGLVKDRNRGGKSDDKLENVSDDKLDSKLATILLGLSGYYSGTEYYGGIEILEKLRPLTGNATAREALDNLEQVYMILKDYGYEKYISIDLGMLQNPNFYTGVIFKGFTYDIGFPLLRGGRYDRLVEKFGNEMPATGFSMGVNMLMTALERQGVELEKPNIDTVIGYKEGARQTAIELCGEFRRQGLNVELDLSCKGKKAIEEYAARKNIRGYIFVSESDEIEICNLENGEVNRVNPNELIGTENGRCGQ